MPPCRRPSLLLLLLLLTSSTTPKSSLSSSPSLIYQAQLTKPPPCHRPSTLPGSESNYNLSSGRTLSGGLVFACRVIDRYVKNGDLASACKVFDEMPERSTMDWNMMLLAYSRSGKVEEVEKMFNLIPERGVYSFNIMLSCYLHSARLEDACRLGFCFLEHNDIWIVSE